VVRRVLGIGMLTAALVLAAGCGGGGNDSGGGGSGTLSHEAMCELAWKDGGQQKAQAQGQSKKDYMAECVRVMSGAGTSTTAP